MTLHELLEKLEAATGPDRELDAAIFEARGYRVVRTRIGPCEDTFLAFHPDGGARPPRQALTASIDVITALIEEQLESILIEMQLNERGEGWAEFTEWDVRVAASAPTLPLALCIALVKALIAQEADDVE